MAPTSSHVTTTHPHHSPLAQSQSHSTTPSHQPIDISSIPELLILICHIVNFLRGGGTSGLRISHSISDWIYLIKTLQISMINFNLYNITMESSNCSFFACVWLQVHVWSLVAWSFNLHVLNKDRCPHGHSLDGYCYVPSLKYGQQSSKVSRQDADVSQGQFIFASIDIYFIKSVSTIIPDCVQVRPVS